MTKKIVILGAGPCGLAAAYKLAKEKTCDFEVFEKAARLSIQVNFQIVPNAYHDSSYQKML